MMRIRTSLLTILFLSVLMIGRAQIGGQYIYNFLNLNNSSRVAGLGGGLIAASDDDPALILNNPSLIGERHHTSLEVNAVDYFSNASYGSVLYSHTF